MGGDPDFSAIAEEARLRLKEKLEAGEPFVGSRESMEQIVGPVKWPEEENNV